MNSQTSRSLDYTCCVCAVANHTSFIISIMRINARRTLPRSTRRLADRLSQSCAKLMHPRQIAQRYFINGELELPRPRLFYDPTRTPAFVCASKYIISRPAPGTRSTRGGIEFEGRGGASEGALSILRPHPGESFNSS
jgi:hypothetical protein